MSHYKLCPACGWELGADALSCPKCQWGDDRRRPAEGERKAEPVRACEYDDHGYRCGRRATHGLRKGGAFCPEHHARVVLGWSEADAKRYHSEATSAGWTLRLYEQALEAEATPAMRTAKSLKQIQDPQMKRETAQDLLAYMKDSMRGFGELPYDPSRRQG